MFSVRYTGMNFLPLCTASVCPTISGTTVDRRDQVLMTFLSAPRFITSIFSSNEVSTNGPFFRDLLIVVLGPSSLVLRPSLLLRSRFRPRPHRASRPWSSHESQEPRTRHQGLFLPSLHDEL